MDKGFRRGTEKDKRLASEAVQAVQWESVESDTESLAQERAAKQQVKMNISCYQHDRNMLPQRENSYEQLSEDSHDGDYLHVYDSLEEAANLHVKRTPDLLQTTCKDQREGGSQLLPDDDDYSDLHYDPNWRRKLPADANFKESPQTSVEEYYQIPKEKSSRPHAGRQETVIKGGYRFIADTHPAVVVTPPAAGKDSEQPYHLHPPATSQEAHLSGPLSTQVGKVSDNKSRSLELMEDKHAMFSQENLIYNQQEERRKQAGAPQKHPTSKRTSPRVLNQKKQERVTEDIVERNKVTLGRNKTRYSSYKMVHALKPETPHPENKVTQIRRGSKAQRKENPSSPQQQQLPPNLQGQSLSPRVTRPLQMSSSQPLPPTIHVNISLNTSSLLHPPHQMGQDAIISLASLHDYSHWIPESEAELALSHKYSTPRLQRQSRSPEQRQRVDDKRTPNEIHCEEDPEDVPRTHANTSYKVLPPIRKLQTGSEAEMNPQPSVNTAELIHRSSSDGYLSQMEKQKQRARGNYKAYSLTDYKQLKSDINLRGLGPDYTAIEKTAEKLRRQRLYSNVIREQNKKISRIPFLPAKDLESKDMKVPRMKALEYAKSIAKPPVQSKPKPKHRTEDPTERALDREDLDLFEQDALDILRKRHEEEKQRVALFRKVHVI